MLIYIKKETCVHEKRPIKETCTSENRPIKKNRYEKRPRKDMRISTGDLWSSEHA